MTFGAGRNRHPAARENPRVSGMVRAMKRRASPLTKTLIQVAFLGAGLVLVRMGALPFWLWCVLVALAVGMNLLARMDVHQDELVVSDQGITRQHGSPLRQKSVETVRWDQLTRVDLLTREVGPDNSDMLYLLHGQGEDGVAVSGALAEQHGLVGLLRGRLAGFREDQLQAALAAQERATFTLWESGTS